MEIKVPHSPDGGRIVADGVGNRLQLILRGKMLEIKDLNRPGKTVQLTHQEVEIVHAFLSVALVMPRNSGRVENLEDEKTIALVDEVNPKIRIAQEERHLDIHPASWEMMMCEIALIMPRMRD